MARLSRRSGERSKRRARARRWRCACVPLHKPVLDSAPSRGSRGAQDVLLAEERLNAAMRFDVEDADAEHDNHSQSDYSDRSMSGEGARVKSLGDPVDVVIRFRRARCRGGR